MLATLIALAVAAQRPPAEPDIRVTQAAQLFDRACLRAFPDDAAVDGAMRDAGATSISPDDVKITLRDDPGRGWTLQSGATRYLIFLELPPFHACSVRWMMPDADPDLSPYQTLLAREKAARSGFQPANPYEAEMEGLHIHATGEQRIMPEGGVESFFVFSQSVADPARRARGETATNWRFVRQFAPQP